MNQKVLKVGTSAAVTIPKKSLDELGLKIGDRVLVDVNEKERMVSIKPASKLSTLDRRVARLALSFINHYRHDLEALAKR